MAIENILCTIAPAIRSLVFDECRAIRIIPGNSLCRQEIEQHGQMERKSARENQGDGGPVFVFENTLECRSACAVRGRIVSGRHRDYSLSAGTDHHQASDRRLTR